MGENKDNFLNSLDSSKMFRLIFENWSGKTFHLHNATQILTLFISIIFNLRRAKLYLYIM